jgi:hypothetical protein
MFLAARRPRFDRRQSATPATLMDSRGLSSIGLEDEPASVSRLRRAAKPDLAPDATKR